MPSIPIMSDLVPRAIAILDESLMVSALSPDDLDGIGDKDRPVSTSGNASGIEQGPAARSGPSKPPLQRKS